MRRLDLLWITAALAAALALSAPLAAQQAPGADPIEDKLRAEMGALAQEYQKVVKEHASACHDFRDDFALASLKVEKCALLTGRYTPGPARDEAFRKTLAEARDVLASLAAGKKYALPATGLVEHAYLSDVDGSAQPYYLYVPEKLPPGVPPPVLLFLHGYVGSLDKVNWLETTMPEGCKRSADRLGAVLVAPFARSNTDFQGLGERDVLKTIDLAIRETHADPDRVWLAGCSMGASGVWTVGSHYPDRFAAAIPASGRTDYNLWQNVPRGTLAEYKQLNIDRDFAITLVPNFRNLPVFAFHGEDDWLVQPEQSKSMVKALQAAGFEAILHIFPKGDHWTCFDAYESDLFYGWTPAKRLNRTPLRVTYRTYHPRFNRAYWVTIDDFTAYGKPAEIDVRYESPVVVVVKAENVAKFTLDCAKAIFQPTLLQARMPDGKLIKPVANKAGALTFLLDTVPAEGLRKRAELSGPAYEAYQQPFMMVYGSQGSEETKLASRKAISTGVVEWYEFAAGIPRVKKDEEITEEDIKLYNLVLYGTPATNSVVKRIAEKLPVTIGEGKFTVGKNTFEGENLGMVLCYPNPLNPEKLVVVHSGLAWGAGLSRNHKLDLLPDYIVYDDTFAAAGGTNNYRVAGYFDINWKLDDKLMWFGPEKTPPKPELEPTTPSTPAPLPKP